MPKPPLWGAPAMARRRYAVLCSTAPPPFRLSASRTTASLRALALGYVLFVV
nr:MAG TPA: hypothetical protein [Caudoviricetes sp.]